VIGSRLKQLQNTLLTVIGLSGATIIYVLWWQHVFRVASNAEVSVQSLPHFLYLWGGNAFDLGIASSIAVLVVLNVPIRFIGGVSLSEMLEEREDRAVYVTRRGSLE
jgi:hypothetical protein